MKKSDVKKDNETNNELSSFQLKAYVASWLPIAAPYIPTFMHNFVRDLVKETHVFHKTDELPDDIVRKMVGDYLTPAEKVAFAKTTSKNRRLLQPELQLTNLLLWVAQGKQPEAHGLLTELSPKSKSTLLLQAGIFTDYSGRTFNCTAYEYAYWAKDTHMCRMLERTMDENTKAAMLKKVTAIDTVGLTYEQRGQMVEHSKHFDMTPLKIALQNYVNGYDAWVAAHNHDAMKAAWMLVGLAQRDLPVHVINEYCRPDQFFYPLPTFNEDNLPRILTYYNLNKNLGEQLFPLVVSDSSGLGVTYALLRAGFSCGAAAAWLQGARARWGAEADLAAVSRLDEVRTADLMRSRENLLHVEPEHGLGLNL